LWNYKKIILATIVVIVAAYFLVPYFNQRMNEILWLFGKQKPSYLANSFDDRKLIWNNDLNCLHNYLLTCAGPGSLYTTFKMHWFFYSLSIGRNFGYYDTHNEYLWQWLAFGITGMLVFC